MAKFTLSLPSGEQSELAKMMLARDASQYSQLANPFVRQAGKTQSDYIFDLPDDVFNSAFAVHDAANLRPGEGLGGGLQDYNRLVSELEKRKKAEEAAKAPATAPSTPGATASGLSPVLNAILNPSANPDLPVTSHPLQALLQPDPTTLNPQQQANVAAQNNYDIMNMPPVSAIPKAGASQSLNDLYSSMYTPYSWMNGRQSAAGNVTRLSPLNTVNRSYFPQEMNYFSQYGQMPQYRFFQNLSNT